MNNCWPRLIVPLYTRENAKKIVLLSFSSLSELICLSMEVAAVEPTVDYNEQVLTHHYLMHDMYIDKIRFIKKLLQLATFDLRCSTYYTQKRVYVQQDSQVSKVYNDTLTNHVYFTVA